MLPVFRARRGAHRASILSLVVLLLLGLAACRDKPAGSPTGAPRSGKWKKAPKAAAPAEERASVEALPYLRGYNPPVDGRNGVVLYDRERAAPGLNLLASGHAAEAILFDMEGRELRHWALPLEQAFPNIARLPHAEKQDFWRRVRLLPDGSLLAIYEGLGVVKIDRASRLRWKRPGNFHHDLDVAPDGTIWLLDRDEKVVPRINPTTGVLEDFVTKLGRNGKVLERISILRAFEDSPFASFLDTMPHAGDILHTNTLELLDGSLADKIPAFKAGNLLVSVLQTSTLAVIDPETRQVVWALRGKWRKQHQPTVLANDHLLLFDNIGLDRDHSRALEIDPRKGDILWQYAGTASEPLTSRTLGSVQRLANGNTLITEAERGRAVEVTPDNLVVWEYHSPFRTGEQDALVAALLEVIRIAPPPKTSNK